MYQTLYGCDTKRDKSFANFCAGRVGLFLRDALFSFEKITFNKSPERSTKISVRWIKHQRGCGNIVLAGWLIKYKDASDWINFVICSFLSFARDDTTRKAKSNRRWFQFLSHKYRCNSVCVCLVSFYKAETFAAWPLPSFLIKTLWCQQSWIQSKLSKGSSCDQCSWNIGKRVAF